MATTKRNNTQAYTATTVKNGPAISKRAPQKNNPPTQPQTGRVFTKTKNKKPASGAGFLPTPPVSKLLPLRVQPRPRETKGTRPSSSISSSSFRTSPTKGSVSSSSRSVRSFVSRGSFAKGLHIAKPEKMLTHLLNMVFVTFKLAVASLPAKQFAKFANAIVTPFRKLKEATRGRSNRNRLARNSGQLHFNPHLFVLLISCLCLLLPPLVSSNTDVPTLTNCSDIQSWQTYTLGTDTRVTTRLSDDECVRIEAKARPTLTVAVESLDITPSLRFTKELGLDFSVYSASENLGCKGGWTYNCAHLKGDQGVFSGLPAQDKAGLTARLECYSDVGWGEGCFIFGAAHLCTVVNFAPPKETLHCSEIQSEKVVANLEVSVGDSLQRKLRFSDWSSTALMDLEKFGKVRMDCVLKNKIQLANSYLCTYNKTNDLTHFLVPKTIVDAIDIPYRHPNSTWRDISKVVNFERCDGADLDFSVNTGLYEEVQATLAKQTGVFRAKAFAGLPNHVQVEGDLDCTIDLRDLKPVVVTYDACTTIDDTQMVGTSKVKDNEVRLLLSLSKVNSTPCTFRFEDAGCTLATPQLLIKDRKDKSVNVRCSKGSHNLKILANVFEFEVSSYGVYNYVGVLVDTVRAEISVTTKTGWNVRSFFSAVGRVFSDVFTLIGGVLSQAFGTSNFLIYLIASFALFITSMNIPGGRNKMLLTWLAMALLAMAVLPLIMPLAEAAPNTPSLAQEGFIVSQLGCVNVDSSFNLIDNTYQLVLRVDHCASVCFQLGYFLFSLFSTTNSWRKYSWVGNSHGYGCACLGNLGVANPKVKDSECGTATVGIGVPMLNIPSANGDTRGPSPLFRRLRVCHVDRAYNKFSVPPIIAIRPSYVLYYSPFDFIKVPSHNSSVVCKHSDCTFGQNVFVIFPYGLKKNEFLLINVHAMKRGWEARVPTILTSDSSKLTQSGAYALPPASVFNNPSNAALIQSFAQKILDSNIEVCADWPGLEITHQGEALNSTNWLKSIQISKEIRLTTTTIRYFEFAAGKLTTLYDKGREWASGFFTVDTEFILRSLFLVVLYYFTRSKPMVFMALFMFVAMPSTTATHVGCAVDLNSYELTCGLARSVDWDPERSLGFSPIKYIPFGPEVKLLGLTFENGVTVVRTTSERLHSIATRGAASWNWFATLKTMFTDLVTIPDPDGEFNLGLPPANATFNWTGIHEDLKNKSKKIIVIGDCATNLGDVNYVTVSSELHSEDSGLEWHVQADEDSCARTPCRTIEAECYDDFGYCSHGVSIWRFNKAYGFRYTSFFQGVGTNQCHHKRRGWKHLDGWLCSLHSKNSDLTRAHILPHTNGGQEHGYNCWPQTSAVNQNATYVERNITSHSLITRSMAARFPPLDEKILVVIPPLYVWRVGCFCGWNGKQTPPSCAYFGAPLSSDADILVIKPNQITEAVQEHPNRRVVAYTVTCISFTEELSVRDKTTGKTLKIIRDQVKYTWTKATALLTSVSLSYFNPVLAALGTTVLTAVPAEASEVSYTILEDWVDEEPAVKARVPRVPWLDDTLWRLHLHWLAILLLMANPLDLYVFKHNGDGTLSRTRHAGTAYSLGGSFSTCNRVLLTFLLCFFISWLSFYFSGLPFSLKITALLFPLLVSSGFSKAWYSKGDFSAQGVTTLINSLLAIMIRFCGVFYAPLALILVVLSGVAGLASLALFSTAIVFTAYLGSFYLWVLLWLTNAINLFFDLSSLTLDIEKLLVFISLPGRRIFSLYVGLFLAVKPKWLDWVFFSRWVSLRASCFGKAWRVRTLRGFLRGLRALLARDLACLSRSTSKAPWITLMFAFAVSQLWQVTFGPQLVFALTALSFVTNSFSAKYYIAPLEADIQYTYTKVKVDEKCGIGFDERGELKLPTHWYDSRISILLFFGSLFLDYFASRTEAIICLSLSIFTWFLPRSVTSTNSGGCWSSDFYDKDYEDADLFSSASVPDGVYRIYTYFLIFPNNCGFITFHEGVGHTSYHVTGGAPLYWNDSRVAAYEMQPHLDIVTYNGPWCLKKLDEESPIYLTHPHTKRLVESRVGSSKTMLDGTKTMIAPTVLTEKGESGSPIFQKENGELVPVAFNGLNYSLDATLDQDHAVFSTMPSDSIYDKTYVSAVKQTGHLKVAALKPGSGKTRVIIPNLVRDAQKYNRRMVIVGPTRVVTREIVGALRDQKLDFYSSVGNSVTRPTSTAGKYISVMCHATYHSRIMSGKTNVHDCDVLVIDEAGFAMASTIHLSMIFRKRCQDSMASLIELSATGEVVVEGSRYPVEDKVAGSIDKALESIEDKISKKIIVFSHSAKELHRCLKEKYKHLNDWPVLRVDRKNFSEVIDRATDVKAGLLVCTRIAEAGFNPGADIVIDTQMDVVPTKMTGRVELVTSAITYRQSVQRRGRVGRRKPGVYIVVGRQVLLSDRWNHEDALWDEVAVFNHHPLLGDQPKIDGAPELKLIKFGIDHKTLESNTAKYGASAAIALANTHEAAAKHTPSISNPKYAKVDPQCANCPRVKLIFFDARWHKTEDCPRSIEKIKMPDGLRMNSGYTLHSKMKFFCPKNIITAHVCHLARDNMRYYFQFYEFLSVNFPFVTQFFSPTTFLMLLLLCLGLLLLKIFLHFSRSSFRKDELEAYKRIYPAHGDITPVHEVFYPLVMYLLDPSEIKILGLPLWVTLILVFFSLRVYKELYSATMRQNSGVSTFLFFLISMLGPSSLHAWTEPTTKVVDALRVLQHTPPSTIQDQVRSVFFDTASLLEPACIAFWWFMVLNPLLLALARNRAITDLFGITQTEKDYKRELKTYFCLEWVFSGGSFITSVIYYFDKVGVANATLALLICIFLVTISFCLYTNHSSLWALTQNLSRSVKHCQANEGTSNFQLPKELSPESVVKFATLIVPVVFSYCYWKIQPEAFTSVLIFSREFFPREITKWITSSAALVIGALIRRDYGTAVFHSIKILMDNSGVLQTHSLLDATELDDLKNLQMAWWNRFNRMDNPTRERYSQNGVTNHEITNQSDDSFFEMSWLVKRLTLPIKGVVRVQGKSSLGCAKHLCTHPYITSVQSYHYAQLVTEGTLGSNRAAPLSDRPCDWVVDFDNFGNRRANREYDLARLARAKADSNKGFVVEISSGYNPDIMSWLKDNPDCGVHYNPDTSNSYPTLYVVSGRRNNRRAEFRTMFLTMLRRMRLHYPRLKSHHDPIPHGPLDTLEDPIADTRFTLDKLELISLPDLIEQKPLYTYKTWENLGSKSRSKRGTTSNLTNGIFDFFTRGIRQVVPGFENWVLSSTTADAFHETFMRKYDRKSSQTEEGFVRFQKIMRWMANRYMIRARRLSNEEIIQSVESGSSVGHELFGEFLDCPDLKSAMLLPEFWAEVDAEEERLTRGQSKYGIFNSSPKREKISVEFSERVKNKRMIAYFPGVLRALEYRWLGFLNTDHLCSRENLPCGVGGLPLFKVPNLAAEKLHFDWSTEKIGRSFMCRDVSGWDTRMTANDLRMERSSILKGCRDPLQARMIIQLYCLYTHPVVAIPRAQSSDKDIVDFVQGYGQRMSGSIVTYAMNTWTNAATLLLQKWETVGYTPGWLEENAHAWLGDQLVAGDDSVIIDTPENLDKLKLANDSLISIGKPRKGLDDDVPGGNPDTPTPISDQLKDFNFCSHNISVCRISTGSGRRGKVLLLNRSLGEIFGKMRLARSNFKDDSTELAFTAGTANQLLLCYPHRRDCRLLAGVLKAVLPPNLIPMGYQSRAFIKETPWLELGDLTSIFNKMYEYYDFDSGRLLPAEIASFGDITYSSIKEDQAFGSPVGTEPRNKWKKALPSLMRSFVAARSLSLNEDWYPQTLAQMTRHQASVWSV
ncbi:polyprotein [Southern pygmy squid flavivirus]|nr:polyprotein [Southern pygmy squid flavivirus]